MKAARYGLRGVRLVVAVLGGMLALVLLLVCLAGPRARAGPSRAGTGVNPRIEAITVSASMPVSDTRPGDGVAKTIYFSTPGVLTLTLALSGTPTLTLATDAAFGEPARTLTFTDSPWDAIITYTVEAEEEEEDWPGIEYTASNASGVRATVPITYLRDTAAPTVDIDHPVSGAWISGPVTLSGTATDGTGAGVRQVEVQAGVGAGWTAATGTSPWAYVWAPPDDQNGVPHTLSVRAIDYLDLESPPATRVVHVDNVMAGVAGNLTSTTHLTGEWSNQNVVTVTWSPADDGPGSGLEGYAILWDELPDSVPDLVQSLDSAATNTSAILGDGAGHYFHIRAVDQVSNWAAAAAHLGPIQVDTISPTRPALLSPLSGTVTHVADVTFDWSDADDGGSGVTGYNIDLNGAVYTTAYSITTVTSLEDGVYAWTAQALDTAGNASGYTDTWDLEVDTVPPTVTIVAPSSGAVLTTMDPPTLTISGTASDAGAGLGWVDVSTGATWVSATETGDWSNWTYAWTLPPADNETYTLIARAFDNAGNVGTSADVTVTVDKIAPTTSRPVPHCYPLPYVTSIVTYTWPPSSDGSEILGYQICITNIRGVSETFYTPEPAFIFTQAISEGLPYFAQARALDGVGNWGSWSALSDDVIPDLTIPSILTPSITESSPKLHSIGTQLYYTNTMPIEHPQTFAVRGYSEDHLSQLERVRFSRAFGDQPLDCTEHFRPWYSNPNYGVDRGETASGVISATVYDWAGNTNVQTYTYELDGTPPEATAYAPISATSSPIDLGWLATDLQSGVRSVGLWYKKEATGSWEHYRTVNAASGITDFDPSEGEGVYCFAAVAEDNLGNLEAGPTVSEACTHYYTQAPQSQVTWAPPYMNSRSITVEWAATPFLPEYPLTVSLWYNFDGGGWLTTGLASAGISGTFAFTLPYSTGDGVYGFATVARQQVGMPEALPLPESCDATTIYDTQPPFLTEQIRVLPTDWARTGIFTLTWTNPDDLSGIAGAYYSLDVTPTFPHDGIAVYGDNLEQLTVTVTEDGEHTVWVWLVDRAGNVGYTQTQTATLKYDASVGAPRGLMADPSGWSATDAFSAMWSNPDDLSGIVGAYYKPDQAPTFPDDGTWVAGDGLERIDGISVGSEGVHTLHIWLQDAAGNVDLDAVRAVDLHYDATLPTSVTITAPGTTLDMSFVVSWSAADSASGVAFYAVEYSGTAYADWQPWLPSTTQTSAEFDAPLAERHYAFRVTAYDGAGNNARARTQSMTWVELQRVHLPLVPLHRWPAWYAYDEYEPNDTIDEAFGPLKPGQVYTAYIWDATDPDDYYYFVGPSTDDDVEIWLTDIPLGADYELCVCYYNGGQLKEIWSRQSNNEVECIPFEPVPGRKYWVRVFPYYGFSSEQPYRLEVTYRQGLRWKMQRKER